MHKQIVIIILVFIQIISSVVFAQEKLNPTIQELKEQTDAVLSHSNVFPQTDIDIVFELADRLIYSFR